MAVNSPDKQMQLDKAVQQEAKTYKELLSSINECEVTMNALLEKKKKLDEAKKKFITVALIAIGVLIFIKLITG